MASARVGSALKNLVTDKKCRIGDNYLTQRLLLKSAPFELLEEAIEKTHISLPDAQRFSFERTENRKYNED